MSTRSTFTCANPICGMLLLNPHATRGDDLPSPGDMIVCGACRVASVVTLLATRLLTEAEIADLPAEVKDEITFAMRALNEKLKQS